MKIYTINISVESVDDIESIKEKIEATFDMSANTQVNINISINKPLV